MIAVNTRILSGQLTGVQRYATEILNRVGTHMSSIAPRRTLAGIRGHVWEQNVLPLRTKGRLLWSPSNTGPILVRNQVVTIHDVVPLDHPEWLNPRFAAWYRFVLPRMASRVTKIITDSEFTKGRILDLLHIPEERVVCIPLGVDSRFHPKDHDKVTATDKSLGLPSSRYVLSLGSLEPRKNLGRLLQAWQRMADVIDDDIWLVIAGATGKSSVFQQVEGLNEPPPRVHFTGHIPDEYLPDLYSGAIAFVYLSEYEGFGLPPLEAMASGTPPLTGNRTALPEVVGDAGLMVDPFDIDAIADGIRRLLEHDELRSELRVKGLYRASQFSWDRAARETLKVLRNAER